MNKTHEVAGICARSVDLTITDSAEISGNHTRSVGGGLSWTGRQLRIGGTIQNNQADVNGGGIYHSGESQLEIDLVRFTQNAATQDGWDIYNAGPLRLSRDFVLQDGLYLLNEASIPEITGALDEIAVI